ncbi:hypothetical protein Aconfl_23090 [Algoriphagus confluentis]|uniref:Outer membrane protein TolC n=2 Tax=Algoriphagus confluentis TaxID=1697556 RepID=A0ABQ6PNZ5_9BACT|nr:hypothetical protein Aconfl_23090 [Algoriphagus confluentis]
MGLFYLSCQPAFGQDLVFHTLEEVLFFAKENSPEQRIRALEREKEGIASRMSRTELLPAFRAYGTWDNYLQLPVQLLPSEAVGGEPGTFTEIRFGTQYQINLGVEASLPLFDPELWSRIKSDRLRYQMGLQELSSKEQAWTEEIARMYFQVLLHEESLRLAEARYQLSDSIFQLAEFTFQAGEMEPLPFQRIKASALSAQHAFIRQQKQRDLAKSSLTTLIGAGNQPVGLSEKIQSLATKEEFSSYELNSLPSWRREELALALSQQAWKQSRASYWPKLTANGRFYQQTLGNNFNLSDASSFEVGVWGLSLNWTIFQGNQKRLKTKTAYLDWQIAKERQLHTQQILVEEQNQLDIELRQNQQLVNDFAPLQVLYEENYRLAGIQWAEGQISTDELLQVEKEWIEQQQEYLIALSDLFTSKALQAIRNQSYTETP